MFDVGQQEVPDSNSLCIPKYMFPICILIFFHLSGTRAFCCMWGPCPNFQYFKEVTVIMAKKMIM